MSISRKCQTNSDVAKITFGSLISAVRFPASAKYFPTKRIFSLSLAFVAHSSDFH
jgi:hypothetical protein